MNKDDRLWLLAMGPIGDINFIFGFDHVLLQEKMSVYEKVRALP